MGKIQEIYVRDTRDELGRYPNWPVQRPLLLGSVGFYDGRAADFDWVTSLAALKIDAPASPAQGLIGEMYTTLGAVNVAFQAGAAGSVARFMFSKARAVATQGFRTSYEYLAIGPLETAISEAIENGSVEWDFDWVVVTELWRSDGFTTLISGAKGSSAEILAPPVVLAPFFQIHRLAKNRANGRLFLKRYGRNTFSFWPKK